ncbi:MAG: hypothetical protein PHC90_11805, partial [Syntrophorhabdaceae bacterium]|nr:hypothetical protein [Syntrophorhabdaceae bacterium]
CRRQEAILMEAAHNFRNSIVIIGGFSRRIARLSKGTEMAGNAVSLQKEVKALEKHFTRFEKYMNMKV